MRQLLFISYYFPPSGGPGVQRTLKFVKYLPQFGWQPTVLTVDPKHASYPNVDTSLEAEVPSGVEVIRTKSWDPYSNYARLMGKSKDEVVGVSFAGESDPGPLQKVGRWIRANIFIPDARVGWVPFALTKARSVLQKQHFDAVVTTGPPHSTHLIGLRLAGGRGVPQIPWLADFRDPWTQSDYYQDLPVTRIALAADRRLEQRVLSKANRVVVRSPTMKRMLRSQVARDYELVMNGFDPADFDDSTYARGDGIVIRHLGNMPAARNPDALWRALRRLEDIRGDVRVELVGSVDPVIVQAAEQQGVGAHVTVGPYVDHAEAIRLMKSADILLLVVNNVKGAEGIMTGKLFEYMAAGRPVLGIGPVDGDAAEAIGRVSAGEMFDYDDAAGVSRFLAEYVDAVRSGKIVTGASWEASQAYSRVSQCKDLSEILTQMTRGGQTTRSDR